MIVRKQIRPQTRSFTDVGARRSTRNFFGIARLLAARLRVVARGRAWTLMSQVTHNSRGYPLSTYTGMKLVRRWIVQQ
jgi:hypothetical protein